MKKIAMMLLAVFLSGMVQAAYEANPDKVPSIGLNVGGTSEAGDSIVKGSGASTSQNMTVSSGHVVLDLRLPVSDSLTFSASLGSISTRVTAEETPILFGNDGKTSGLSFDVGIRYYLH